MLDKDDQLVSKGFQSIGFRLDRYFVSKGKITEQEKQETLARIAVGTEIEKSVTDADIVIEAIVENLELKKEIFKKLDQYAPTGAILGSNTSLQNISEMAFATKRPDKVVGIHFFNPVDGDGDLRHGDCRIRQTGGRHTLPIVRRHGQGPGCRRKHGGLSRARYCGDTTSRAPETESMSQRTLE